MTQARTTIERLQEILQEVIPEAIVVPWNKSKTNAAFRALVALNEVELKMVLLLAQEGTDAMKGLIDAYEQDEAEKTRRRQ